MGTRHGGRSKGTPNKRTKELIDKIEECYPDYDPVVRMAQYAMEGIDYETKMRIHQVLETLRKVRSKSKVLKEAIDELEHLHEKMPTVSLSEQIGCHREVAQYIHAKRKAVEVKNDGPLEIVLVKQGTPVEPDHPAE